MKCLILLLSSFIISAFGKIEYSKNYVTFYTQELKSTSMSYCNNKTGLSCPNSIFDRDNRMMFCGWRCPHDTLYRCKEDADHGIVEFCAKRETCDKGQMNRVYFDDKHQRVVIQKDTCPEGLFQPFEEDCFTACTKYRHVDESFLPERGIAVLYHGNSTYAGLGYCDVDRGYVNIYDKMYINLTGYEVNSVCDKLENYENKCGVGQRLLPDSRCVPICEHGYVVNKEDFFKCSLKSNIDAVITSPSSEKPSTSTESGISSSKHITSATKPPTTTQQSGAVTNILIAIISVLGAILVALNIYCIVKHCRQKNKKAKDSRCVPICEHGYVVNKEDFFKCSLKSNIDAVITSPSSEKPSTSTESGISSSKHITSATKPPTTTQQSGAVTNILIAIISVLGAILVALNIYCIVKHCRQKNKKAKGSRKTRKCKTMYKECKQLTVNAENGVVNINIDGEAAKTWTSLKTLPADVESDGEKTSLVEPGRRDEDPVNDEQTMMELKSFSGTEDQDSGETAVKMVME